MLLVERHQWGRAMAGAMPIPARTSGLIRRNPIHLRFLNSSQSKTNSVSDDTADPRSWHSAIKPIYVYDTQVEQQIQRGLLARFCGDQKVMDAAIGALRESRDSPVALRAAMGLVAMEVPADRLKNTAGNHSASYAQLLAHAGHPERALRALGARSMSPGQFVFQCLGKWGDDAFLHGGVGPRRLATTMRLLDHVGAAGHSESLLAAALASPTKQPNATKSRDNSYSLDRRHDRVLGSFIAGIPQADPAIRQDLQQRAGAALQQHAVFDMNRWNQMNHASLWRFDRRDNHAINYTMAQRLSGNDTIYFPATEKAMLAYSRQTAPLLLLPFSKQLRLGNVDDDSVAAAMESLLAAFRTHAPTRYQPLTVPSGLPTIAY
ncbi:MAG: hypothetical protein AAFN70_18820, partial [Planctomycetota bacterium]